MFKFFRKKQPSDTPAGVKPVSEPPQAPDVPDAGGWGRAVAPQPVVPPTPEPEPEAVAPSSSPLPPSPPAAPPASSSAAAPETDVEPETQAETELAPVREPAAPTVTLPQSPASPSAETSPPGPDATPAPVVPSANVTSSAPRVGGTSAERPGQARRRAVLPSAPAPSEPVSSGQAKTSWLARLKTGLSRTGQNFSGLFVDVKVDEDLFEELETALIMADAGVEATNSLLTALRARVRKERIEDGNRVKEVLRELLTEHLSPLQQGFDLTRASPLVVMIAGVNGAGKTTSIGKLARAFQDNGSSVLLAAGDTFRAAAREQLVEWGERNNVAVIAQGDGGDPAAVAFDAVQAGRARGMGVVMVDTAGRLPTQLHLMSELKKIHRVIGKADSGAPHEVLLVVDGNTGQNALAQIKAFDDALGLTGLVVTKLDGTAKGGILAAVAAGSQGVRPVPVYWIGVGEGVEDLQPFVASEFAGALLG